MLTKSGRCIFHGAAEVRAPNLRTIEEAEAASARNTLRGEVGPLFSLLCNVNLVNRTAGE